MMPFAHCRLDLTHWLALHLAGFTVKHLVAMGDSLDELFVAGEYRKLLQRVHLREKQRTLWPEYMAGQGKLPAMIEQCLAWLQSGDHHHIITCVDVRYPALLLEINSPPLLLFASGNADYLTRPMFAMVGSRNPTASGIDNAKAFASDIASRGFPVVSGLALGVDTASHSGALETGGTVAVLGTGIDVVYPRKNLELARAIRDQGVLVSEFMLGTAPLARHFPQRNRIIGGMSLGVLVVEAAQQSGSLITARLALDANREVFAIPGSIHNPLSKGCHRLIREGATLVEGVSDIFEHILVVPQAIPSLDAEVKEEKIETMGAVAIKKPPNRLPSGDVGALSQDARLILSAVGFEPTPIDMVTERTKLNVSLVNALLIELEMEGHVRAVVGGYTR